MQPLPKAILAFLGLLVVFNLAGWLYIHYRQQQEPPLLVWPVADIKQTPTTFENGKAYFSLPEGTPIYTAFSGTVTLGGGTYFKADPPQSYRRLIFTAPDGREMEYIFLGEIIVGPDVAMSNLSKTVVARVAGEELYSAKGYNLELSLHDEKGELIPLSQRMFQNRP